MQYIRCDVATMCVGQAASMGSLLLAAGKAAKRYALPNSRIMIHQPSGGFQGQAADIEIQAREILALRARLNVSRPEIPGIRTSEIIMLISPARRTSRACSPK